MPLYKLSREKTFEYKQGKKVPYLLEWIGLLVFLILVNFPFTYHGLLPVSEMVERVIYFLGKLVLGYFAYWIVIDSFIFEYSADVRKNSENQPLAD